MSSYMELADRVRRHIKGLAEAHVLTDGSITLSDVTTNDVSITKHGFAPKAPNLTTKFLRGDATWAIPSASEPSRVTNLHVADDFAFWAAAVSATGTVSGFVNWSAVVNNASATQIAAVAGHPGLIQFSVANSTARISLFAHSTAIGSLVPSDFFDITVIVRPSSTVDSDMVFRFGLTSAVTNATPLASPTDGIYVEKKTGDTSYFGTCRASAAETRTSALGTVTNGTWAKFRMRRVDASTIGFTQDAGVEQTITTNIPTAAIHPVLEMSGAVNAVVRTLDLDLYDFQVTSLTR